MSIAADRPCDDTTACRCWHFAAERSLACADCTEDNAANSNNGLDLFYADFLGGTNLQAPLVDSHCHLQLFPSHRDAAASIHRARSLGQLSHMVVCGVTPLDDDWARVEQLYRDHSQSVVPCFGLHPWWIAAFERAGHTVSSLEERLVMMLERHPQAHIGECGLDKALTKSSGDGTVVSLERQAAYLQLHLRLAGSFQRSVTLHCVGCWGRLLTELQQGLSHRDGHPLPTAVVLHSCNSMAADLVAAFGRLEATTGVPVYFSVSGRYLFSENQRRLVQRLPVERLLLETDSPDQLPAAVTTAAATAAITVTRNEPVVLRHVLREVAALKATDPIVLAERTTANAREVFALSTTTVT